MESKTPKLYDWEVLSNVAPYLNMSELLKTSILSKEYSYTLKNYLRKHVLPKQQLSTGHQNQLAIAKKFFHRQIQIANLAASPVHKVAFVPNLILKNIQVGSNFTLIETIQGKKHIVQNNQLLDKHFDLKTFYELEAKYYSKFVTLVGDYIYTVRDTKLLKLALKDEQGIILEQEGEIMFEADITAVKVSQTHLFVITTNTFHQNHLFAVHVKQLKNLEVLYEQEAKKTKHIEPKNLSIGANTAYYINKFKVFELDIQKSTEPKLMKSLKDKQIRRIFNGSKHFFAVEKGNKLTEQWDTKDLVEWAYKEGYEDYIKIFKSEKVTGNILLSMEKRYMEDVLGILNVKVQQRLMVQLQECNVEKEQNCTVYGWGRNDRAQLGLNPSNPVSNPHKLTLPDGFTHLICSNNITLIHNKKTGKVCFNSVLQNKFQWVPVLQKVSNIWSISIFKDLLIILCPVAKQHVTKQLSEAPINEKKQKLRTAKNIVDKIQWDQNIDKKEFRVGYLDKYTGILEIPFEQLVASTQIKQYRIEYFKKNGEILWSKKDRIDIF